MAVNLLHNDVLPTPNGAESPRARIGFIILSTDPLVEREIYRRVPDDVAAHFTRIHMKDNLNVENLGHQLDQLENCASLLLPNAVPDVICYACTSGSIVMGEELIIERLSRGLPGATATTLVSGVCSALEALGISRLAIATPYIDEINRLEADYFVKKGYAVVNIEGLHIKHDLEISQVRPSDLIDFARKVDQPDAEALFLSCSALRSIEVIETLEQDLKKPVLTSNQAMLWNCLRLAGVQDKIAGLGELMSHSSAES